MQFDRDRHPGPFCQEYNVQISWLCNAEKCPAELPNVDIKNGLVLELVHFASHQKLISSKVVHWLKLLVPIQAQMYSSKTLQSKISRTVECEKKMKKKKKHSVFKCLEEFQSTPFFENLKKAVPKDSLVPTDQLCNQADISDAAKKCVDGNQSPNKNNINTQSEITIPLENNTHPESPAPQPRSHRRSTCSTSKCLNQLKFEVLKHQKQLKSLTKLIESDKLKLERIQNVRGHFSVRNVTKRDENANRTRQRLCGANAKIYQLQKDNEQLASRQEMLNAALTKANAEIKSLKQKAESSEQESRKKLHAQKLNSYYRSTIKKLRERGNHQHEPMLQDLKHELKKKDAEMDYLVTENELLLEQIYDNKLITRNEDGTFRNEMRLCIMELFGLEIGVEKISMAIHTVSKHLFNCEFQKSELPSNSTVQSIVDEGHYIAKAFIAESINQCQNFGISRDGTTRRKEKIIDTTVTLDNGQIMSLGFTKVARETAKTITEITKQHFQELERTHSETNVHQGNEDFIQKSLQKLSYTMSDRASNEILANKFLTEWREETLKDCATDFDRQKVLNFHCMAHVLLGFHKYVCEDMKKMEKDIVSKEGPIGRDSMPVFKYWSKKQTVIERVNKTTSDIFGPAGDHLGVRDKWEAHCSVNGTRSFIGNYKDNRFNALFQTAAEILFHREDFIKVINTVPNKNLKIKAVLADLQSDRVQQMLQALCLIYVTITGPYWWLITSGTVPYLELAPVIKQLESFLQTCTTQPELLVRQEINWLNVEEVEVPHIEKYTQMVCDFEENDFLLTMVKTMCGAMLRTVQKQLKDFLVGGQFSECPAQEDMQRTAFAHVTNLGCEHHFGDLDSSQRRRPNASFHHHTSVQILKRNRQQMFKWLGNMDSNEQDQLLKTARGGGRLMRKRHREEEDVVDKDILNQMHEAQSNKKSKTTEVDEEEDYAITIPLEKELPSPDEQFIPTEYVIVAYQDCWYPGMVTKCLSTNKATVNFMVPCRKPGNFTWPARKDEQEVEKQFVLRKGLLPEAMNSGRQWFFKDYTELNELYNKYKECFFK